MKDLYRKTASELVAGIRGREFTAEQVAQSCLERIQKTDSQIHAWAFLNPEQTLRQARAVDAALSAGTQRGTLVGVPVGIKDIYNTADFPTEMGSRIWKGFTPGNDARVVFNLRYEGAVVAGKTVTSEFAVHEPTQTVNPWALDHVPGTSSTGSAAAVAAGHVPFALGSQTGGSTIRPASYCGVFGYKPSFGLVPRTGVLKTTDTLDTIAWFSRSIDDIELFFEALRVKGLNYPIVHERVQRQVLPSRLRVGFYKGPFWSKAERYAQQALTEAVSTLSQQGAYEVREVDLPESQEIWDAHEKIYCRALSYYFRSEERNTRAQISAVLVDMLDRGEKISPDQYHGLTHRQGELTHRLGEQMADDVWVTLSSGGEAPKNIHPVDRPDSCKIWTYLGMPTMSLPLFKAPNGLPFGLQIIAPKYADYRLLDAARQLWRDLHGKINIAEPAARPEPAIG